jgi:hypothetical protein
MWYKYTYDPATGKLTLVEEAEPAAIPRLVSRCPAQFRLVTRDQIADEGRNDEFIRMFGGRLLHVAIPHVYGWQATIDGVTMHIPAHWVREEVTHDFPNNGTARSWCSGCGCEGHWNWRQATYEPQ